MTTDFILQLTKHSERQKILILTLLGCLLVACTILSISVGPVSVGINSIILGLKKSVGLSETIDTEALIVEAIRLPRTILGLAVGFALGVSGAALQGLFRNPLVDPSLIGVSAGGALGAAFWILIGQTFGFLAILDPSIMTPIFAFVGSILILFAIYKIGSKSGYISVTVMLLAGIALNAIAGALLGIMIFASDDFQLRAINFWTLGSIAGGNISTHAPAMILAIISSFIILFDCRNLNLLMLGETEAKNLGCEINVIKRRIITLCAISTAAAVSVSGIIGFIGLVAPHLIRLLASSDNKLVLPGSGLLGAILILVADMTARLLVQPAELPLGVMTAIFGAPFFIWLLIKKRGSL